MRLALVAIACNEDHYFREWFTYHHNIGFDDIFVYENNWHFKEEVPDYVHLIDWPGSVQQLPAYNDFINNHNKEYDWALFIDIDEFFAIGEFEDAKEAFSFYKDYYGVGFNWKLFGSNGHEKADYSKGVIERFTKSLEGFNKHIKTAINLKRCNEMCIVDDVMFVNPHFVGIAMRAYFTIRADLMKHVMGPWSEIDEYSAKNWTKPWIAHYATKSNEEFIERRSAVRADTNSPREDLNAFWTLHDRNDVENLDIVKTAQQFM